MGLNIFDNSTRRIVCIENDHNTWGDENANCLLEVGEEYTLIDIDVYSFYSLVTLREFPDVEFNSVLFEEVDE